MGEAYTIIQYIGLFPSTTQIYRIPTIAMGLTKLLDEDVRKLVFSLVTNTIHISRLKDIPAIKDSLGQLIQIRIINKTDNFIKLNPTFRNSLLAGLCCPTLDLALHAVRAPTVVLGQSASLQIPLKTAVQEMSRTKFQMLLQAVISRSKECSYSVEEILMYCELLDEGHQITSKGFEFLLKSRTEQCWFIVLRAIKYFAESAADENAMLLETMEMVMKRDASTFRTTAYSRWFEFLNSIGIIHLVVYGAGIKQKGKHGLAYWLRRMGACEQLVEYARALEGCTQCEPDEVVFLLNNACFFEPSGTEGSAAYKYIILETNYKIYAYTDKSYEKNILALFSRIVYVLPNMVKSQLDEESMCRAFAMGITAAQILKYLTEFARHIPPSVANQIRIWENKQHRIKSSESVLYSEFLHLSDYLNVLNFLEQENAVLLKDENKRIIIGTEATYEKTKEFIKRL